MTREMHPQRWGDADQHAAAVLPEGARALVEAVFGPADARRADRGHPPAPALPAEVLAALADAVGEAHVSTDDDVRRRRTRGKSTPDLLRARAGRPHRRARRGRPPGRPRRGRRGARGRRRAPRGRGPVRRWHVRHGWARRPPRRLRRRGQPGPRPPRRRHRRRGLDDRRPRARATGPRGRGRPGRARRDPRATSRSRSSTRRSAASPRPGRAARRRRATDGSTPWSSA